jgi:hypothetical protein
MIGGLKGARGQGASPLKYPLFRISKVGNPIIISQFSINFDKYFMKL